MTEQKLGFLLLVDVVNYTPQAVHAGTEADQRFLKAFHQKVTQAVKAHEAQVLTFVGDAALIFVEQMDRVIGLIQDLREKSREGYFDSPEMIAALRFVAHYGHFQLDMVGPRMENLYTPDGITVFRMEKLAGRYEVLMTNYALHILKDRLAAGGITWIDKGTDALKGFEADDLKTDIFTLVFPEKALEGEGNPSGLLEEELAKLERDCQKIPVLGDLYDPLPMAKNFIQLQIKTDAPDPETLAVRRALERERDDRDRDMWDFRKRESRSPIFTAAKPET